MTTRPTGHADATQQNMHGPCCSCEPQMSAVKPVGEAVKAMENSLAAKDVTDTSKYAAIFVPGGHGISADGPDNPVLQKLLVSSVTNDGLLSHGVERDTDCSAGRGCATTWCFILPSGRVLGHLARWSAAFAMVR